jgi:hypothetical protein
MIHNANVNELWLIVREFVERKGLINENKNDRCTERKLETAVVAEPGDADRGTFADFGSLASEAGTGQLLDG